MSISKSQADLLATGFLNQLGSDAEFAPKSSLSALIVLAGGLVEEAAENLNQGGHNSSGDLSDSFKVRNPEFIGKDIRLDVEALYRYQFLNKGVRGTKSGSGKFSFKNSFPNRKMVENLLKGIDRAKLSTTNVNPKKPVGKQETKNVNISDIDKAWGAARNIKMKGIKKTGFFDKAIKTIQSRAKDELSKALKVDIINSLPDNL